MKESYGRKLFLIELFNFCQRLLCSSKVVVSFVKIMRIFGWCWVLAVNICIAKVHYFYGTDVNQKSTEPRSTQGIPDGTCKVTHDSCVHNLSPAKSFAAVSAYDCCKSCLNGTSTCQSWSWYIDSNVCCVCFLRVFSTRTITDTKRKMRYFQQRYVKQNEARRLCNWISEQQEV